MFKLIFRSHLGIIVKNISLTAILVLGLAQTAKADESSSYQDLRISCDPAIDSASRLNCSFNTISPETASDTNTIAQGGRGRRRKSKVEGYYGGFSLGAMLPTGGITQVPPEGSTVSTPEIEYSTGFAASVFGGVKLSKSLGAELEFLFGTGSSDSDEFNNNFNEAINNAPPGVSVEGELTVDNSYTVFALYASPRFDLPVSEKFNVFVSPGIGISQTNLENEVDNSLQITGADDVPAANLLNQANGEDLEEDFNSTGISFKIKGGAEYKISDSIAVFGQASYVTLPTEDSDRFELDSLNSFLAQAGLTFNF